MTVASDVGSFKQMSASANVKPFAGVLQGIFVSTVSGSPTLAIYDSARVDDLCVPKHRVKVAFSFCDISACSKKRPYRLPRSSSVARVASAVTPVPSARARPR